MNTRKKKIGIKYCGGCNPGYDRVGLVEKLKSLLQDEAVFFGADEEVDLVLAVEGCPTCCADLGPYAGREVIIISSENGLPEAVSRIKEQNP